MKLISIELKAPRRPTTKPKFGIEMASSTALAATDTRDASSVAVMGCKTDVDAAAYGDCFGGVSPTESTRSAEGETEMSGADPRLATDGVSSPTSSEAI